METVKRILLIGGTGVLSSAVTHEAINQGLNITMINRGHRSIPNNVELIKADKDDLLKIRKILETKVKYDAIVDFLCYTPLELERSYRLYSAFTNQYIFISSCAVYDKDKIDGISYEDSPKGMKVWDYSVNKTACEDILIQLYMELKTPYTIVRPCVTYDDTRIPYGIMPKYKYHWTLVERIIHHKPIIVWNNGENRCNIMRVEDFAAYFIGLVGNLNAYNNCYNLCGNETPTFNEVLSIIEHELRIKADRIDIPPDFYARIWPQRRGEILGGRSRNSINSNKKIKRLLPEYHQKISLKDGIIKTLYAYKTPPHQNGIDWAFEAEWDYVITAWLNVRGISPDEYNLKLINYNNTLTMRDKVTYWSGYHKDSKLWRIMLKIIRVYYKVFDKSNHKI